MIGNYLGVDVNGINAIGDTFMGIGLSANDNFIGGTTEGEGNLIGGSTSGIVLNAYGNDNNFISYNNIGVDESGRLSLDVTYGIQLEYAQHNIIQSNNISYNQQNAVNLDSNSNYNILRLNNLTNNQYGGILLFKSTSNRLSFNDPVNSLNAFDNGSNIWANNYWGDYKTKYPSANEVDHTGIGDTPYSIAQTARIMHL